MKNTKAAADYVQKILGLRIRFRELETTGGLPVFLMSQYYLYHLEGFPIDLIAAESREGEKVSASAFKKHAEILRERFGRETVLITGYNSATYRSRLIDNKVQFIVPGKQFYLPALMIDLREHFSTTIQKNHYLSPPAQVLVLYKLLKDLEQPFLLDQAKEITRYSKMTVSRAVDELIENRLCSSEKDGRIKSCRFNYTGRDLWNHAEPLLQTPVSGTKYSGYYLKHFENILYTAGISCLSQLTMIGEEAVTTYAMERNSFKKYKEEMIPISLDSKDDAPLKIEVWKYDPAILTDNNRVDPLSLYLSLRNTGDERVRQALDELLEGIMWR